MKLFFCKRLKGVSVLFVFASLLFLAACGGGQQATEPTNEAPTEEAAAWEPTKPVEYIAPANPGGGWDTLARTTARVIEQEGLAPTNFPVINVPGSGGAIAWAQIAADSGNPHKLFVTSPPIILVPLSGTSQYDHTDFTPIARLITDYSVVLVKNDSPYETINDLFEAIKENPQLSIGGGSAAGSMDHISIVGAAAEAGVDGKSVNYVAFSGGGEAMTNLLGGHVEAVSTGVGEATAQIQSGELRALALSSPERLPNLPDVPTYIESGIDFTFDVWRGVMGPKDMPAEAVAYYEKMYADMLETDNWNEAREQLGWINAYQSSEEFGQFLDAQYESFKDILSLIHI